jgi:hypothetical protein
MGPEGSGKGLTGGQLCWDMGPGQTKRAAKYHLNMSWDKGAWHSVCGVCSLGPTGFSPLHPQTQAVY